MVRRALSFNRKPRKRGADGGEFTALLEGSAEDREARLLARRQATATSYDGPLRQRTVDSRFIALPSIFHMHSACPRPAYSPHAFDARGPSLLSRRQATARTIERAMHALAADAPRPPSDAELADPARMATYIEALSAHAARQHEALQAHDAEVRENQWISAQLEQLEMTRRREAAALAEWGRQQEVAAGRGVVGRSPLAPLNRTGGFGAAAKADAAAVTALAGTGTPAQVTPAKYSQRVDRARAANRQRIAILANKSLAINPLAPRTGCSVSPQC